MWPVAAKVGLGGLLTLAGYKTYRHFYPKLQSLRHVNKEGHAIQVVVPVTGTPPAVGHTDVPIPPNNGTMAVHTPPRPAPPKVLAHEPTVITPSGAANLNIDNVSDAQHALNALGHTVAVTGVHDAPTAQALSTVQTQNGLPATGILDHGTAKALEGALNTVAGGHANVGQSLPVQAAATVGKDVLSSPVAQNVIQSGLGSLTSLFSGDTPDPTVTALDGSPATGSGAAVASKPAKDAICHLQNTLNELGASPPLKITCELDPETVAALKAFQITTGLVADGVPGPKTVTALVATKDPVAHDLIVPTIPKAAAHVAAVAETAPIDTKVELTTAAAHLTDAAANPAPHPAEVNASTAAGLAATASSVASPEVAAPLAKAAKTLASASNAASAPPTALSDAATHLATAAANSSGPAAASLQTAADHVSAAAAAPNADKQAEHLNSAATHLANASNGAAAPAVTAVAASGEFDGAQGGFGFDFNPFHRMHQFWGRHFARLAGANVNRMRAEEMYHHHRRHFAYSPQAPIGYPAPPIAAYGEHFGYIAPPRGGSSRGYGGGFPGGGYQGGVFPGGRRDWRRREWAQQQAAQMAQGQPPMDPQADAGDGSDGGDTQPVDASGDRFGGFGSRVSESIEGGGGIPSQMGFGGSPFRFGGYSFGGISFGGVGANPPRNQRPPPGFHWVPYKGWFNAQGIGLDGLPMGHAPGMAHLPIPPIIGPGRPMFAPRGPIGIPRPPLGVPGAPLGYPRRDASYWNARRIAEHHDEYQAWLAAQGGVGMPPTQFDPNAQNQYNDPNASDPTVQDPSLDAQSDNPDGATDDSADSNNLG
jgi:hypothetical protein